LASSGKVNIKAALNKFQNSIELFLEEDNYFGISKTYIAMAELILSNDCGDYLSASKYYDKASKYFALDNEIYDAGKYSELAAIVLIRNPKNEFKLSHYKYIVKYSVNAKNYYGNAGYYEESGKMFQQEMHYRMLSCFSYKKLAPDCTETGIIRNYFKGINYFLNEKLLGFGESISRIIVTTISIISLYAFIYWKYSLVATSIKEYSLKYYDYFFYSAAAFATVNFGDFTPTSCPFARVLVVTEAFAGVFIMALIVLVVSRKFSRR
jgi:hypothetical protein